MSHPKIPPELGKGPSILRRWRNRQEPRISLVDLAEALGYTGHRTLQRWETGKQKRLDPDKLVMLAGIMDIDAEELAAPDQIEKVRALLGR